MSPHPAGGRQWTERSMLAALYLHFAEDGWAPLCQVTVPEPGTITPTGEWTGPVRRLDMLLTRRSPTPQRHGPLERMAVEVKVTRSDFLLDVRNPAKQRAARWVAHTHIFAVPAGLVRPDEVPADSGLLYVHDLTLGGRSVSVLDWQVAQPALPHPPDPQRDDLGWLPLLYAQRAADAEARLGGFTFTARQLGDDPADLHAAIDQLRTELHQAQHALRRQGGRHDRRTA